MREWAKIRLRVATKFSRAITLICPSGGRAGIVSIPPRKNILLVPSGKSKLQVAPSRLT
jgi:hypothetical protein